MKVKNRLFEDLATKNMSTLLAKPFTATTSYWLARIFDKVRSESRFYFQQKKKLIEKYAKRRMTDGKKWKKGDIIMEGDNIMLKDSKKFNEELSELLEIEVDLNFEGVKMDLEKEPSLTIDEMTILLPFIKEIENG